MDFTQFNRDAWDRIASNRKWFAPVDSDVIEAARKGQWSVRLTGTKPVPMKWLGEVKAKQILCLAGGGGHQGPILAAAGADVTVFDLSAKQLQLDKEVAKENGLEIHIEQGDMTDLSCFGDECFDLIINPCSVNFCPEVLPVWREAYRVLRNGGELIAGMINPVNFLFDAESLEKGKFVVRHRIPYSDWDLPEEERERTIGPERPIDFGHSLEDLIGGQAATGFHIIDMFEDRWGGDEALSQRIATFLCTRARKC